MLYPLVFISVILLVFVFVYRIKTFKKSLHKKTFVVGYDEEEDNLTYHIKMETQHGVFDRLSNNYLFKLSVSKKWLEKLTKEYKDEAEAESVLAQFLNYLSSSKSKNQPNDVF